MVLNSAGETRMVASCEGTRSHLHIIGKIEILRISPIYIALVLKWLAQTLTVFGVGLLPELLRYTGTRGRLTMTAGFCRGG